MDPGNVERMYSVGNTNNPFSQKQGTYHTQNTFTFRANRLVKTGRCKRVIILTSSACSALYNNVMLNYNNKLFYHCKDVYTSWDVSQYIILFCGTFNRLETILGINLFGGP